MDVIVIGIAPIVQRRKSKINKVLGNNQIIRKSYILNFLIPFALSRSQYLVLGNNFPFNRYCLAYTFKKQKTK